MLFRSEVPLNQSEMSWTITKIPKEGMNKEGMNKEGMVKEFDGSTSPL